MFGQSWDGDSFQNGDQNPGMCCMCEYMCVCPCTCVCVFGILNNRCQPLVERHQGDN